MHRNNERERYQMVWLPLLSLPRGATLNRLLLQQHKCSHTCVMFLPREACLRLQFQCFYQELITWAFLVKKLPNHQTPRRKARAPPKTRRLQSLVTTKQLYQLRNISRARFPDTSQGPALQANSSEEQQLLCVPSLLQISFPRSKVTFFVNPFLSPG